MTRMLVSEVPKGNQPNNISIPNEVRVHFEPLNLLR